MVIRRFVVTIRKGTALMKEIIDNLGITVHFVQNKDVTTLIQKPNVHSNREVRTKTLINRDQVLHLG